MALFLCKERVVCPGSDSPISNWSSEDPDLLNFAAFKFPIWNPNNPTNGTDTTGWMPTWLALGCTGLCVSTISLQDAELCAQRAAFICANTPTSGVAPTFAYNTFQSCAFTCPDGTLFVWNIAPGAFVALSEVAANQMAQAYACQQAALRRVCLGDFNSPACIGDLYSSTIQLNGAAPVGVELTSGSLPPGLTLTQNQAGTTATLSGVPTTGGVFTFTLTATDASGNFHVKNFTFGVLNISNAGSIPNGTQNTAYSFQLDGEGGAAPYSFALAGGSLPDGLSLSSTGLISGTPTTNQTSAWTVQLIDAAGNDCLVNCSMTVAGGACIDWTKLDLWSTFTVPPAGGVLFLPGQPIDQLLVQLNSANLGGGVTSITDGELFVTGGYTGPGCKIKITTDISKSGDPHVLYSGWQVFQNGVLLGGLVLNNYDTSINPTTIVTTLTLNAGVADQILITFAPDSGGVVAPWMIVSDTELCQTTMILTFENA